MVALPLIVDVLGRVADKVFPNAEAAAAAKLELLKLQQSGELTQITGQLEVNKIEAASERLFVAGWRPFVGWVCGVGLAYAYIGYPVLLWVMRLAAPEVQPPQLVVDSILTELLLGMLGLGGLRTVEKLKRGA